MQLTLSMRGTRPLQQMMLQTLAATLSGLVAKRAASLVLRALPGRTSIQDYADYRAMKAFVNIEGGADPRELTELLNMGFDRERSIRALQKSDNNVALACDLLVG